MFPWRTAGAIVTGVVLLGAVFIASRGARRVEPGGWEPPSTPAAFDPRSVGRTARWAGELLKPLEAAAIENGIVRADAVKEEIRRLKAVVDPLVGQSVSWDMECTVHETSVSVRPLSYARDGTPLRMFGPTPSSPVAIKLVDRPPDEKPEMRFADAPGLSQQSISVEVPHRISREDAAALKDRVILNAEITGFEVGRNRDDTQRNLYLLYIYLSDFKLAPATR